MTTAFLYAFLRCDALLELAGLGFTRLAYDLVTMCHSLVSVRAGSDAGQWASAIVVAHATGATALLVGAVAVISSGSMESVAPDGPPVSAMGGARGRPPASEVGPCSEEVLGALA